MTRFELPETVLVAWAAIGTVAHGTEFVQHPLLSPVGPAAVFLLMLFVKQNADEPATPTERAKAQYAAGEIDLPELERRVGVYEDDRAERIRAHVEAVNGVGEDTSFALAREFESLDELRDAGPERLQDVPNVGEQRAAAIRERV